MYADFHLFSTELFRDTNSYIYQTPCMRFDMTEIVWWLGYAVYLCYLCRGHEILCLGDETSVKSQGQEILPSGNEMYYVPGET